MTAGFDRVVVFDIKHTCDANGCPSPAEILLVAQLKSGGIATRWVCPEHEATAIPSGLTELVFMRAPAPSEVH